MPTSVTGTIKLLDTTSTANSYVRFWLRGLRGNEPRITGTGAIAPQAAGSSFYVDLPADANGNVSGTIYSTRDASGTGPGEIEVGGSYTAVTYGMVIYSGSIPGPEVPVHAKNGATLDITSVTPVSTKPVVTAPTGDTTYARLDGGNQPFTSAVNSTVGYRQGGTPTAGHVLRSNGTNFVDAALAAADLSNGVTGSGAAVLATSPTLTTPTLNSATLASATLTSPTVSNVSGLTPGKQIFTSSGTFTIPSGVKAVKVTVVGAGGAGGGATTTAGSGGGGAGGGWAVKWLTGLTPGNTLTVTIGSGGTGNANATGGSGGNSTVASGTQTISTITGSGGAGALITAFGLPAPANSSGGDINGSTMSGQLASFSNSGGMGGPSLLGGGGNCGVSGAGGAGNAAGSGGGGAGGNAGGAVAGGGGANGIVIFEWIN